MKQANRVFHNATWIIGCKIVQALMQLVIGMLTARYLGPADYGLVNYAVSITAFAVPIMHLGLQSTLVQEYVRSPEKSGEILGTSMVMTFFSGLLSMVGVVGFSLVANGDEPTTILVCALYSITLLCQSLELIQYWYHANMLSKYSALITLAAYVVTTAYKVFLLITAKSIFWFALSHAVEYAAAGVPMLVVQRRLDPQKLRFSRDTARDIFSRSRYYILASLMITVFRNTDHIMLKLICGDIQNGFYTTAITCSCVGNFVYYGIIEAARPAILESQKVSDAAFEQGMIRLFSVILWISLAQALCFTFLAEPIVRFLFGQDFLAAVPVLQILSWQIPFLYLGTARDVWILGTGQHSILWKINLGGVITNVMLNAWLIPSRGACGAAFASALTQFFVSFAVGFLSPKLRRSNQLLLMGLHPKFTVDMIRQFLHQRNRRDSE